MLRARVLFIVTFLQFFVIETSVAQDVKTIVSEDFAIRDFTISKDSIYYIKKRSAYLLDRKTNTSKSFFIGGYGLKLNSKQGSNELITVANELVDTVCSVRFYNKKDKDFDFEFYYKKGKAIDFLDIPEAKVFVLSLSNKKIFFIDYSDRPEFIKTIEINTNSLTRKLIYKDKILYFATDNGRIYKYNYHNYSKTLLYDAKELITEFDIIQNTLVYSTIKGSIFKVELDSKTTSRIDLNNSFISALKLSGKNLVCGSWNGSIFVIDLTGFSIVKQLDIHERAVLKIKNRNSNFYSSSLDKTIKSWRINK